MTLKVDAIRECLEGVIPGIMATASPDGTPNISYLSQVQFIDGEHIALSYQFFNKTRQNILANPRAMLTVTNPVTAAQYRLTLQFLRTETSGPLFESMKARLAGIASHTGMSGVFRLLGADVFRVVAIERVPGESLPPPTPARNLLAALRAATERLSACSDLDRLLTETLACLDEQFGIGHTMVLMLDAPSARLYTVASRGYEQSGVGSEIAMGQGVIGVAARERTPIRIGHMNSEYAYSMAIRQNTEHSNLAGALETAIPLPGLAESRSQLAVPICVVNRLLGVLYVESPQDLRFTYDDEDALVTLAAQIGTAMHLLQNSADAGDDAPPAEAVPPPMKGAPLLVRYFPENDSVFLGDDYLIKGVAGSIFWNLARDHVERKRTEFTNRELRLDPRIRLPDISDNLEARLILLSRRLAERDACVRIEKTGRGRFRLCVKRPIQLMEEAG
ncbi:GAF domain-containing protein [Noviherbaspirillum cavernae]|uniref:GAF domain-containing protein n=1 Tax=Noviherbaspirillum cavernae TaxID=2320862 RepID=A0A418X0Z5_9BURK|nr:GAF domain-containing protein [Noviherbaspirillum cavernae]RJG06121.1 GAF domain-containing protein [Noviherbaspirillum cavernae]